MNHGLLEKLKGLEVKLQDSYVQNMAATIDSENLILQVQRSPQATMDDFLFEVGHYLKLLRPGDPDAQPRKLLHVACGNGLYNLVFTAFYREIVNLDPVEEMLVHARRICRNLEGQTYVRDYGHNIGRHYPPHSFDDVFCIGIANIVADAADYFAILDAVSHVVKEGGRLVLGRIPDLAKRDPYLASLPAILAPKGFSRERIEQIVRDNRAVNWYAMEEITRFLKERGGICTIHPVNVQHIGHECMSDISVQF